MVATCRMIFLVLTILVTYRHKYTKKWAFLTLKSDVCASFVIFGDLFSPFSLPPPPFDIKKKNNGQFQQSLKANSGPSKVNLCTTKFVDDSKTPASTEIAVPIPLPEELKHVSRNGDADMPPGEGGGSSGLRGYISWKMSY